MSISKLANCLLGGSSLGPPSSGSIVLYVHRHYGYVVLTMVGSMFLVTWKAFEVGKARKQLKIFYPIMYSSENNGNNQFNCVQRAHQNTLESYPTFLTLLAVGGLEMPVLSAIAGIIWIAGRVAYAKGYYTGDPKNRKLINNSMAFSRMKGSFGYIGLLMLLGATTKFGLRLLSQ